MAKTYAELIRKTVVQWAKTAPIVELVTMLPDSVWDNKMPDTRRKRKAAANTQGPSSRVIKKINHEVSKEESEEISKCLCSLRPGTNEYVEARDKLCKKFRLTVRQVSGVIPAYMRRHKKTFENLP